MEDVSENDERFTSLALNQVLEDICVTKEMIHRRRTTFQEKEANMNLSEMLIGLKTLSFHFQIGSQIEAATTLGMHSDVDSLRYMNDWPVILSMNDWKAETNNLLIQRDHEAPPQHCYLQRLSKETAMPMTTLPLLNHSRDDKGRILIKNTYFSSAAQKISKQAGKRYLEHGPSVSHSDMLDYVFCFHCKKVPDDCRFWINRPGQTHWPPEEVKMTAIEAGIFLLPLGHPESSNSPVEWRYSTSFAERLLMFALNESQLKVYILLKMIKSAYIKKVVGDRFSSYHMKTALLYTIEKHSPNIWREDNLLQCVTYCLVTVAKWLREGYIPNYTIADVNLLTGKLKRRELPNLENMIWTMINTNLTCLLNIKSDDLGERFWSTLHNKHLGRRILDEQFASRAKQERVIISELADQYYGGLNHSLNEFLVQANKVDFDKAYQTIKTDISRLALGLLHPDRIKRDNVRVFVKYMSSVLATMLVSKCIRDGLPPLVHDMFKSSLDFDLASCKLKLASVYYCINEYETAEEILSNVERSFQPFVLSACECRNHIMKKPNKAFVRRALASTIQYTLKGSVAFCVKFLRHEMECVPKHLIFEMYRACSTDDSRDRDPWRDNWMDMTVVDALPFMYYLQYLTYRELGKKSNGGTIWDRMEDARVEAVEKLGAYVEEHNGYGHIETVCNLVGHCFELEEMYDQALEWYLESLSAMPRNNAAKWHISLLFHKLIYKKYVA